MWKRKCGREALTEVYNLHFGVFFLIEAEKCVGLFLAFLEIADGDGGLAAALGGHHDAGGQVSLLVDGYLHLLEPFLLLRGHGYDVVGALAAHLQVEAALVEVEEVVGVHLLELGGGGSGNVHLFAACEHHPLCGAVEPYEGLRTLGEELAVLNGDGAGGCALRCAGGEGSGAGWIGGEDAGGLVEHAFCGGGDCMEAKARAGAEKDNYEF